MKWTREESLRRARVEAERRATFKYEGIEFSPEDWELLRHATLLNRRMLDRGLEHGLLDRALTLVVTKLQDKFREAFPPDPPFEV